MDPLRSHHWHRSEEVQDLGVLQGENRWCAAVAG